MLHLLNFLMSLWCIEVNQTAEQIQNTPRCPSQRQALHLYCVQVVMGHWTKFLDRLAEMDTEERKS